MKLHCPNCGLKFSLDVEKVVDGNFIFHCSGCNGQINIVKGRKNLPQTLEVIIENDEENVSLEPAPVEGHLNDIDTYSLISQGKSPLSETKGEGQVFSESSALTMITDIFKKAVDSNVESIHFINKDSSLDVFYKENNMMKYEVSVIPINKLTFEKTLRKISGIGEAVKETEFWRGQIKFEWAKKTPLFFEVSKIPTTCGSNLSYKNLNQFNSDFDLNNIELSEQHKKNIVRTLNRDSGIILISGDLGNLKRSLTVMLGELALKNGKMVYLLDPENFLFSSKIPKIQIDYQRNFDPEDVFKILASSDTNTLIVPNIDDDAKMASVLSEFSLSQIQIISTTQARDLVSALRRLKKGGVDIDQIVSNLNFLVSIDKIPKICPYCKKKQPVSEIPQGFEELEVDENITAYYGIGCELCNFTGFLGEANLIEPIEFDDFLKTIFFKSDSLEEFKDYLEGITAKEKYEAVVKKALSGEISFDEVIRYAARKRRLQ